MKKTWLRLVLVLLSFSMLILCFGGCQRKKNTFSPVERDRVSSVTVKKAMNKKTTVTVEDEATIDYLVDIFNNMSFEKKSSVLSHSNPLEITFYSADGEVLETLEIFAESDVGVLDKDNTLYYHKAVSGKFNYKMVLYIFENGTIPPSESEASS